MADAFIGVIGGTGLEQIEGLVDARELKVETPYGDPSDLLVVGKLAGVSVAFLPRHGRGHRILPSEIPARANIWALRSLGVEHIIAVNSCGSYKDDLPPGSIVIPDQVIDRTSGRPSTFFGGGMVAHVPFADPICPDLSAVLYRASLAAGAQVRQGGTYVCMEGPAFSTRAESRLYKSWNADVIGMTMMPEAKLAREAEICYASIACITDYDSWKQHGMHEIVTVDLILGLMRRNIDLAREIIRLAVPEVTRVRKCECARSLREALVTAWELIPAERHRQLDLFLKKYLD